jgi:hypothetical protein
MFVGQLIAVCPAIETVMRRGAPTITSARNAYATNSLSEYSDRPSCARMRFRAWNVST